MMAEEKHNMVRDRIANFNKSKESVGATPTTRDESGAHPQRRKPPPPPRPEQRRSSETPPELGAKPRKPQPEKVKEAPPVPGAKPRKQDPKEVKEAPPVPGAKPRKQQPEEVKEAPPVPGAKPRKPHPEVNGSKEELTSKTNEEPEPESETDEDYIRMRAPGELGHDDECIVTVTGFKESVTEEVLRDHFQNNRKSGGGPVDLVCILSGTAAICFNNPQDARRVLERRQELDGGVLRMCPFSESVIKHGFVISGKSPDTSVDTVADFLETKTEHLIECTSVLAEDRVIVLFMRQNCPELAQIQKILKSSPLHKTLTASQYFMMTNDYDEPVQEHSIYTTEEKIRFFKNYKMKDLQTMMKKKGIDLTVDSENFRVKLTRKSGDFQEASPCIEGLMEELHVNQYNILIPGVYTFLRSDEGKEVLSGLEKEETCTVFVEEDIYEDVEYQENTSAGSLGDDSNPSSGSCKSDEIQITKEESEVRQRESLKKACEYGLIQKTNTMGTFQVGKCQFLVKEGNVENEEVECAVNITRSDIDQVGDWKKKHGGTKATLSRTLALRGADWSKKGIIASEVSGLPCKYSILVSLKRSGGNVAKAIKRCIKIADVLKVKSIAFFYKGIHETRAEVLQPFLQDYVVSVYKYQRTESPIVTDIRLVVDRMAEEYIPGVQKGIESLLDIKRKSGIWNHLIRKVGLKSSSSPILGGTGFQTYVLMDHFEEACSETGKVDEIFTKDEVLVKDDEEDEVDEVDKNGQPEHLLSAEAVVSVCSNSEATNNRVHKKLEAICHEHIPVKIIKDNRIQKLSRKQLKTLRRRAGRKVELHVNREEGLIKMRGYSLEVQPVYDNCKTTVEDIPDATPETDPESDTTKVNTSSLSAEAPQTTESADSNEGPSTGRVVTSERKTTAQTNSSTNIKKPTNQSDANQITTNASRTASVSSTASKIAPAASAASTHAASSAFATAASTASTIPSTRASSTAATPVGNKQEDEFDIFGKHIAYELRGITDVEKRTKLKRDIQKLLFMAQD